MNGKENMTGLHHQTKKKLRPFRHPIGMHLNPEDPWIRMAEQIPWTYYEEEYASLFPKKEKHSNGKLHRALGTCIIQKKLSCSDAELTEEIARNPHMQYFIGLPGYQKTAPFSPEELQEFHQKITSGILEKAIAQTEAETADTEASGQDFHAVPRARRKKPHIKPIHLLMRNISTILQFELLYQLLVSVVTFSALRGLFLLSARLSGYR